MNTYLIIVVRDSSEMHIGTGSEVVEFRVLEDASAAGAKAAVEEITDRRPLYSAFSVKLT